MIPLVWPAWVSWTSGGCHGSDGAELEPAIFTGILGFLCAFVYFMEAFDRPQRMARASGCGQRSDAGEVHPTVFTVKSSH